MTKLLVLASYFYVRKDPAWAELIKATHHHIDWLIDSGAFSDYTYRLKAARSGKAYQGIELDQYIEWCQRYGSYTWGYIALDVVNNRAATDDNLDRMLGAGLRPLPVLTTMHDPKAASTLAGINAHVCVAGGVSGRKEWIKRRLADVAKHSRTAKVHALGYVRWPDILHDPLHSADSSSWMSGSMYGTISKFVPGTGLVQMDPTEPAAERYVVQNQGPPRSPMWRGSLGVMAMFTGNAHLAMQRYVLSRGRRYFCVIPNTSWFCSLLACAEASSDSRFNYVGCRALGYKLRGEMKAGRLLEHAVRITNTYAERFA